MLPVSTRLIRRTLYEHLQCRRWRRRLSQDFPFYHQTANRAYLERFLEHLKEVSLPYDRVDHLEGSQWSSETWTYEICRCLQSPLQYRVNVRRKYGAMPTAHVLHWTYVKLRTHKNLCRLAGEADKLFICEIGRGLDLLMALTVKRWRRVQCYDRNELHLAPLRQFFSEEVDLDCFCADSTEYDFSSISTPTLLVANEHNIPSKGVEAILQNQYVVAAILNGEIAKSHGMPTPR